MEAGASGDVVDVGVLAAADLAAGPEALNWCAPTADGRFAPEACGESSIHAASGSSSIQTGA